MPQYDIRLYSSQLLLFHEAILRINRIVNVNFSFVSKETISVKQAVWRGVLVTIETDDRHFTSGSKLKYPFTVQFSFTMLFLMHKCLINYKIDNGFWFNESGDKATPVVSVRKADALFTLINSLYRLRWPDECMYIIMYTMRTNKFVLHTLYCRTTRTPFIDAFYSECIFEHDFDLISGINTLINRWYL